MIPPRSTWVDSDLLLLPKLEKSIYFEQSEKKFYCYWRLCCCSIIALMLAWKILHFSLLICLLFSETSFAVGCSSISFWTLKRHSSSLSAIRSIMYHYTTLEWDVKHVASINYFLALSPILSIERKSTLQFQFILPYFGFDKPLRERGYCSVSALGLTGLDTESWRA